VARKIASNNVLLAAEVSSIVISCQAEKKKTGAEGKIMVARLPPATFQ
jgi:hypothetical protein